MTGPRSADPAEGPARVTLVVGPEELLVERAISSAVASARAQVPDTERRLVDASSEGAGAALAEALSPTLFGDSAVVVVRSLDQADDDLARVLVDALADLPDHIWLVLVHPGGVKGKALLTKVRAAGAVEVACPELKKGRAGLEFVTRELAQHRRSATREAVTALYDAVGADARMLASAVAQLAVDVPADPIGIDDVTQYFGGVADVTGFQISDAVWDRRPDVALRNLRWTAESGDRGRIGPATVGAIASGLRSLIRFSGAPRGVTDQDLARTVGAPPWKVRILRQQATRWRPDLLAAAVLRLAAADAAVKGGLREGENLDPVQKLRALERLILETDAGPHREERGRT